MSGGGESSVLLNAAVRKATRWLCAALAWSRRGVAVPSGGSSPLGETLVPLETDGHQIGGGGMARK